MQANVAVLEPGYDNYEIENHTLVDLGVQVVPVQSTGEVQSELENLDPVGIFVRQEPVTSKIMDAAPNLKCIVRYGIGYDNIDIEAATRRKIAVLNVTDYGAEHEVSDQALAFYLAINRKISSRDGDVRNGRWGGGQADLIPGRRNATLGLIGYGRIAQKVDQKFRTLGFKHTLVYDPYVQAETLSSQSAIAVSLDQLCEQSDVVSIHAPLTRSTKHMLNHELLMKMRKDAILINVSRGGIIDEHALAKVLRNGHLFGAGLDVFEEEPLNIDNPLLTAPRTILSDHNAWYSEDSVIALQTSAAQQMHIALSGGTSPNWVNRW
jgi:D-3-phosphoglycerate dehydrogenase